MPVEPVRVWDPPNPYLTERRELIGGPPAADPDGQIQSDWAG